MMCYSLTSPHLTISPLLYFAPCCRTWFGVKLYAATFTHRNDRSDYCRRPRHLDRPVPFFIVPTLDRLTPLQFPACVPYPLLPPRAPLSTTPTRRSSTLTRAPASLLGGYMEKQSPSQLSHSHTLL